MSLDQINIPGNIVVVEGTQNKHEIWLATISTCMWCKKGKKWLEEHEYAYSFLDIDKISVEEKNNLKKEIENVFGVRPRFPFIVIDRLTYHSGYDPEVWETLLK
ncbi:MAG: glutaredoxin family protein [Candidatus Hodarchaeales archaeon]|jgi:glutaredoxin